MTNKLSFLPDDHHFAIAHVAVRSSQLDHHIEATIDLLLLNLQHTAKVVLKNLGQDRLVDLLGALLKDKFANDHNEIDNLIAAIRKARSSRNDYLHQVWGPLEAEGFAMRASFRPHREEVFTPTTAEDIQSAAHSLMECTRAIVRWQDLCAKELWRP